MIRIRIHPLVLAGLVIGVLLLSLSIGMRLGFAQPFDAAPADASIVAAPANTSLPALPDPGDDAGGFVLQSYKWVMAGGWLALVPFLVGLIWVARHPKTYPLSKWAAFQAFVATGRGAAVLTLAMTLAGMLLHAILATGGTPTFAAIKVAVMTGATAAGMYSLLKALIWGGAKQ
jgi:hypothetical protein